MIRVLLADDFAIIRILLRQMLHKAGDMQVIAMAADGKEAVQEAITHCPHVAIMDISMPTMDGIEATRQLSSRCPETRVLMVSTYHTPGHIRRSLEAGARGYVLKEDFSRELIPAIRTVHGGTAYFSRQIAEIARHCLYGEQEIDVDPETARILETLKRLPSNVHILFFALLFLAGMLTGG